jgi:hypothetical protein
MKKIFALLLLLAPAAGAADRTAANPPGFARMAHYQMEIGALPLQAAMREFADATHAGVVFESDDVLAVMTNPVKGKLTPTAALDRMLAGTGLTYRIDALERVVIDSRDAALNRAALRQR